SCTFSILRRRPRHRSLCFPYTTLFRSPGDGDAASSSAPEGISAAEETVTLLDELGFAPEPVGDDVSPSVEAPTERHSFRLTRCRSEEHTSELQSRFDLVCRILLEKKNK